MSLMYRKCPAESILPSVSLRLLAPAILRALREAVRRQIASLLPLRVPLLGRILGRRPPRLVFAAPRDRLPQAGNEVGALRAPAQLGAQLRGVYGAAAVVPGTVAHPVESVGGLAHAPEDRMHHVEVGALAAGADVSANLKVNSVACSI